MDLQGLQLAANRPLLPLLPLLPPRHNLLAALWTRKTVTTDRLHGDGFMEGVQVVCAGQPLATMTAGEAMCVVRRAVAVAMTAGNEELLPRPMRPHRPPWTPTPARAICRVSRWISR